MKSYLVAWTTLNTASLRPAIEELGQSSTVTPNIMILRHRGPAQSIRQQLHRLNPDAQILVAELTGNLAWC